MKTRVRVSSGPSPLSADGNGNVALIRELHVFGPQVPLNEKRAEAAQHKGLGKALLQEAEKIAVEEFQSQRMLILSGTGAREYYRTEFGYSLEGDYMVKSLHPQD